MEKLRFWSHLQAKQLFLLILFIWFLLNVIQALFTEIGNDESYYWVYSQYLDWGYFDHPPMIALLIKIGTIIAGNSLLGVRLTIMLMQIVFLLVLYQLLNIKDTKENIFLFFIVSSSIVMLQAYGFIATPDSPLLFFTVLFLWSYRFYVSNDYSLKGALLLSVCMAGLMYSKYHGAFVILLIIFSNLSLLKKKSFYFAIIISIVLYVPHILWQFNHDFPSLKYHLVERSRGFEWNNLIDYILNQLPVFNPFTLIAGIYVLIKRKERDFFERALKFLMAGFLIFFTVWTFKSRVEPHWTIAALVPMIILIIREAIENIKLKRYLYKVVAPSIILILTARIFLMIDILPIETEWHGDKQKVLDLYAIAGDRPVVFTSGFQMPSKYRFYTKKESHAMGALNYRNTQYDIWNFDEDYRDIPVVLDFRSDTTGVEPTKSGESIFNLKEVEYYQPFKRLRVVPDINGTPLITGNTNDLAVTVTNLYNSTYYIYHSAMPLQLSLVFFAVIDGKTVLNKVSSLSSFETDRIYSGGSISGRIVFNLPEYQPGEYYVYFAAGTPGVYSATLDKPWKVVFE